MGVCGNMTFQELQNKIYNLNTLDGVDFFTVGYSMLGHPIYGVHLGSYNGKQILIEGAIHAREWITAPLLCDMVDYYHDKSFDGGMYFIPLSNPDGVSLVLDGPNNLPCEKLQKYLVDVVNDGSNDFSQWKANANAVDLNVNFDAYWGQGAQNVFCPAPGNFVGYYPNSEREVRVLIDFTMRVQPNITLSYHTKGEVIYYGFDALNAVQIERDREIAELISNVNGYGVVKTTASVGGYSDWVSLNLGVPAFTVEVGPASAPHPIGEEYLPEIFERNKDVPLTALQAVTPPSITRKMGFKFHNFLRFNK